MQITQFDHLVLTVSDINETCDFYHRVLGMEVIPLQDGRKALRCGPQVLKLHPPGSDIKPRATRPTAGSSDFCLLSSTPMDDILAHLKRCGVAIMEGPVVRQGANGKLMSVYVYDPDDNLIEIANQVDPNYQL